MRRHITYSTKKKKKAFRYFLLKHLWTAMKTNYWKREQKVFEVLSEVNIAHHYFVETNANLLVNIRAL